MNLRELEVLLGGVRDLAPGAAVPKPEGEGEWLAGWRAGAPLPSVAVRRREPLRLRPFSSRPFAEPALRKALEEFHALCPIAGQELGREGWALVLAPGVSWPSFLRCDVASGFTAAAPLHFLLRDRPLAELRFDGESLWAWVC